MRSYQELNIPRWEIWLATRLGRYLLASMLLPILAHAMGVL